LISLTEQLGPLPEAAPTSQVLAQLPVVPPIASQREASLTTLHLVPVEVDTQQVTAPGFPQVDRDAHLLTNGTQLLLVSAAVA
jgi:hypothetical protein